MSVYDMAVRNVARHIRSQSAYDLAKNEDSKDGVIDAFIASTVLSIAFAKLRNDVLTDIVTVKLD